ncbi:MAG: hypothetical protein CSA34_04115 [Desulfobulbus propionicus]|nr:MAG: hypothetical protein CSA34_04115 [Desulfobulbus propionicus]
MSSPWLLAAAAALLIVIVATFALHNYRLEKRLMTAAMLQQATTLMRVLQSGTRSSYINDVREGRWDGSTWPVHAQRVIEHLSEDDQVEYLAVIDAHGTVFAHTDKQQIGQTLTLSEHLMAQFQEHKKVRYAIERTVGSGRVFQAMAPFVPYQQISSRLPKFDLEDLFGKILSFGGTLPAKIRFRDWQQKENYFVVTGLDMQPFDRALSRLRIQILMLSLAMLLVGLGGWFSLSVVQHSKVSQKALNDIQAFTSLLVARIPEGLVATNVAGRIVTWNAAMGKILGVNSDKALGRVPSEVLPSLLASLFKEQRPETSQGEVQEIALECTGKKRVLLCRCLAMADQDGRYQGQVLLVSDVSEVRSLEQQMREQERLAAIGRMAGGVAHEIRNPLSSIKGLAVLLRDKAPEGDTDKERASLIVSEVDRVNRTITNILTLTKPAVREFKSLDIREVLSRAIKLVEPEAASHGILVEMEAEDFLPPVAGDRDRLGQVLLNLLLNAVQAMPDGGLLTISARANPTGIEIRVGDTGEGMDEQTRQQVFYPYFTTKQNGTGLGLAISQKIILDHGGSMRMESQPGQGTEVVIELASAAG